MIQNGLHITPEYRRLLAFGRHTTDLRHAETYVFLFAHRRCACHDAIPFDLLRDICSEFAILTRSGSIADYG